MAVEGGRRDPVKGRFGGRRTLLTVLSLTAGAVDVIAFIALGGLLCAHITGNLAVLAAHFVTGGFSQVGPLLAVPVFMAVLGLVTFAAGPRRKPGDPLLRPLLAAQAVLLVGFLALAVGFGPFAQADSPVAVAAGMFAVAAMAVQNAAVKLAFERAPSTAAMTANVTQLAIDLAAIVRGHEAAEELAQARQRAGVTFWCVAGFVVGGACGAALEVACGLWSLALPVSLAVLAVVLSLLRGDEERD